MLARTYLLKNDFATFLISLKLTVWLLGFARGIGAAQSTEFGKAIEIDVHAIEVAASQVCRYCDQQVPSVVVCAVQRTRQC